VEIRVEDYTRTSLPDESMDVFWALESACYAGEPAALFAEAWRVLRPGGRVVVADGFLARPPRGLEARLYRSFLEGLVLPPLASVTSFADAMRGAGLRVKRVESRLAEVTASARRLFWRCAVTYPLALLAGATRLVEPGMVANSRSGMALWPLVERGVLDYAILVAEKPGRDAVPCGVAQRPDVGPLATSRRVLQRKAHKA
jgi:SAM-dependent methyltransferase